jgi:hypothetical protein
MHAQTSCYYTNLNNAYIYTESCNSTLLTGPAKKETKYYSTVMHVQRKQFQLLHWSITTQLSMDITTVQTSFYIDANKQQNHPATAHAFAPLAPDHQVEYSSIAALSHLVQFTTMSQQPLKHHRAKHKARPTPRPVTTCIDKRQIIHLTKHRSHPY